MRADEAWRRPRFNPRLPGGRRPARLFLAQFGETFQSTPSGGKATGAGAQSGNNLARFNPRLPGGRRHRTKLSTGEDTASFNPRLPGGRRLLPLILLLEWLLFQSTPSGGKATAHDHAIHNQIAVSIHAFRGEGDLCPAVHPAARMEFQSTPSGGKATSCRHQRTPSST